MPRQWCITVSEGLGETHVRLTTYTQGDPSAPRTRVYGTYRVLAGFTWNEADRDVLELLGEWLFNEAAMMPDHR